MNHAFFHPVPSEPVSFRLSRREFLQRLGAVALVASAVRPIDAAAHAVRFPAGADRADCAAPADPTYYMDPGWSA
jgi:hypothetical protein